MAPDQLPMFSEYPTVKVVRSSRRRKTVEARERGGVLTITVPERISREEEEHWTREFTAHFVDSQKTSDEALRQRTNELARMYRFPAPKEVVWDKDQKSRWAYCDLEEMKIGVCRRVQQFPNWVLDYVIVHELAHFLEPSHNKRFWELARRFPRTDRARGYLDAKSEDENV